MPTPVAAVDPLLLATKLATRVARINVLLRDELSRRRISLGQASTLAFLSDHGSCRLTDLAAAVCVAQPSMTDLVVRMERLGWVLRSEVTSDRRGVLIELSPAGELLLEELRNARSQRLLKHLAVLSAQEQAAMAAAVEGLGRVIESMRGGDFDLRGRG
ncbi:MAG: MarR family winged helix-turn-helix transcriptional regulator [Candidatus Dormibacteraceae bacterium]